MGFAADRAGPAESPDPTPSAAIGITSPSCMPLTTLASQAGPKRRLIRAWAQSQASAALSCPSTMRGYDARYARPDMTRERASAEAAAAAAMARAIGNVD